MSDIISNFAPQFEIIKVKGLLTPVCKRIAGIQNKKKD